MKNLQCLVVSKASNVSEGAQKFVKILSHCRHFQPSRYISSILRVLCANYNAIKLKLKLTFKCLQESYREEKNFFIHAGISTRKFH
jgi:hypothetical protein